MIGMMVMIMTSNTAAALNNNDINDDNSKGRNHDDVIRTKAPVAIYIDATDVL